MLLWITHRHPGKNRKSIISEGPKATPFHLLRKHLCSSCSPITAFLQRHRDTWLTPRSLIAPGVMATPLNLLPRKRKVACVLAQVATIMCATPLGYSHATLMMAQGWPSTRVKLKIQLVHQVALHASFQQKTSPAQQIPKSFITTPLRCSFWPQPHKWFIWVHTSVQPSLNWVCRAPSTKELRATRGRSHFNTVWQHPSSVPLLTRQFCKTLQEAGPEGFREPLWAASWEEVTRLANLQSFSCWNKTKCSLCCFIQGRRAAWKYRFYSPPLWCLLNQIDFIPPLKKKKMKKEIQDGILSAL